MGMKILGIGEILWDVFEDGEHLGGAVFNFCAHSARLNHDVRFLSAVAGDERGVRARERAAELGLPEEWIQTVSGPPTGIVTVALDRAGQPTFTIHRPAAYDRLTVTDRDVACLIDWRPDWIAFGTLYQVHPHARETTQRVLDALPGARRFYDVNLRANSYVHELVRHLGRLAQVVKLNDAEVRGVESILGCPRGSVEHFARWCPRQFGWEAVCVTRGDQGCSLLIGDQYVEAPAYPVRVADTVGAGDAFSAALVHGLSAGWCATEIADFANRVGALVASRPGGTPEWTVEECRALA
jgi:fructokinase